MHSVHDQSVPLWKQLQATSQVVLSVRNGNSGSAAIEKVPAGLRPGVQALAFHTWRYWGRAVALRQCLAPKTPAPLVDVLLCTALALAWRTENAPYDPFTLVNQAVEACKRNPKTRASGNFVNACLRRFLRERDHWIEVTQADPVARWNHPSWWIARVQNDHPESWEEILKASNQQAPLTLRVNARKSKPADYVRALLEAGIEAWTIGEYGVQLAKAVAVAQLPGFNQGRVSVQDAAAQRAVPLLLQGLDQQPGMRILDACAAPGGKTGHLLELVDAEVTALEVDTDRCARIHDNLNRLGLKANVQCADVGVTDSWWNGKPFDAILLDAPCTASGIVRRHPDVRWLRRETDVEQLASIQGRMLRVLWPLLKPGGNLLYCTCSLFRAEGQHQIETFLAYNTDAVLNPSPGHLLPQTDTKTETLRDNQISDHDGFFYALLHKPSV